MTQTVSQAIPILDLKPYLSSVPEASLRRGGLAEAEARRAGKT